MPWKTVLFLLHFEMELPALTFVYLLVTDLLLSEYILVTLLYDDIKTSLPHIYDNP